MNFTALEFVGKVDYEVLLEEGENIGFLKTEVKD